MLPPINLQHTPRHPTPARPSRSLAKVLVKSPGSSAVTSFLVHQGHPHEKGDKYCTTLNAYDQFLITAAVAIRRQSRQLAEKEPGDCLLQTNIHQEPNLQGVVPPMTRPNQLPFLRKGLLPLGRFLIFSPVGKEAQTHIRKGMVVGSGLEKASGGWAQGNTL